MTDFAAFTVSEQAYFKRDDEARPGEALYRRFPRRRAHHGQTALKAMLSLLSSVALGSTPRRERRSATVRNSSLDCGKEGLMSSTSFPVGRRPRAGP